MEKEEEAYLKTFNEKERKAYEIAKNFLKSSFDIKKSIGFKKWKKTSIYTISPIQPKTNSQVL